MDWLYTIVCMNIWRGGGGGDSDLVMGEWGVGGGIGESD